MVPSDTITIYFNCRVIFHALSSAIFFFSKVNFSKDFRNTIRVPNSLDPDKAKHSVSPNLGPNCL